MVYILELRALGGGVGGGGLSGFLGTPIEIGEICVSFRGLSDKLRS